MRSLLPFCLLMSTLPALAQSRLDELIASRVEGDRSQVCVQVARIDLAAPPTAARGAACAGARADRPATDARFEIGSISKLFVGVLAAEMLARGEVKLDEALSALLPAGTKPPTVEGRVITLADLLTHTSGLPALPTRFRPKLLTDPYADLGPEVLYGSLADARLAASPGSRYAYSNWAFLMLSDLLARRAGKPYDELLVERVLKPLGMNDTVVARNERLVVGRMANGLIAAHWNVPVAFAGAGGLRSTLDDMLIFARAVLGETPASAPPSLLSALARSREPLFTASPRIDIGMAWHLRKRDGDSVIAFHSGMTGGFSASLIVDADKRRAAVVLADAATGLEDLALRLVDGKTPLAAPRRAVALDLPAARAAAGRYELAPGFVLTLSLDGERLMAQATGQGAFELRQDSTGDYYAQVADILIRMQRDGEGRATALTLLQGGGAMPGKRLAD